MHENEILHDLKKSIKLLSQSVENTPPQMGYPEFRPDLYKAIPEPIGYVYHVSPYAKEIMSQGFIIDPTKTTLGAFGKLNSISTTSYENAIEYKRGIKIVVGVASGEIDTTELINIISSNVIKDPAAYVIKDEFSTFWENNFNQYKLLKKLQKENPEVNMEDVSNIIEKEIDNIFPEMYNKNQRFSSFLDSNDGKEWLYNLFVKELDFEKNKLAEKDARNRRWKVLKAVAFYSDIPAIIGYDIPEHLKNRKISDVGIVEVAVAPVEYTTHIPYKEEDITKGIYSYTPSEKEWKFFDVTDLLPIRIVSHLNRIIKILALNINKDSLHTLWFENENGEKYIPDLEHWDKLPEGFIYQYSRFPSILRTTILRLVDPKEVENCLHPKEDVRRTYGWIDGMEGRECQLCKGEQIKNIDEEWPEKRDANGSRTFFSIDSSYPEDLVLKMATSGDYTLDEAIIIAATSCERCLNVLLYEYGLDGGYPEYSDEWKKSNTECEFCE